MDEQKKEFGASVPAKQWMPFEDGAYRGPYGLAVFLPILRESQVVSDTGEK